MNTQHIIIALTVIAIEYIGVLLAIAADLWSGLRKAQRNNIPRTSQALRRTVDKIARYFNALMALTVIDSMTISAAFFLNKTLLWNIPPIPVFTFLGAISLALIEVKSICEKSEEKGDLSQAADILQKLIKNPSTKELITWLINNRKN